MSHTSERAQEGCTLEMKIEYPGPCRQYNGRGILYAD